MKCLIPFPRRVDFITTPDLVRFAETEGLDCWLLGQQQRTDPIKRNLPTEDIFPLRKPSWGE